MIGAKLAWNKICAALNEPWSNCKGYVVNHRRRPCFPLFSDTFFLWLIHAARDREQYREQDYHNEKLGPSPCPCLLNNVLEPIGPGPIPGPSPE